MCPIDQKLIKEKFSPEKEKKAMVSDTIFEMLKQQIADGTWMPGEKLPSEKQLCEICGASRVSVRAAIQRLSSLGLVISRRGGGTYVCELSGAEHLNSAIPYFALTKPDRATMLEFRRIIEVEGAALAASRADSRQINALFDATRRMSLSEKPEDIVRYDLEFHQLIMESSGNAILLKVFEILEETYIALLTENVSRMGSVGASYHQMIAVAIESRDVELARLLMQKHLDNTL